MSDNRFKQSRKVEVSEHSETVRQLLAEHYGVNQSLVVSVESIEGGAYETDGDFNAHHFLDYAGCDWLIDDRPAIVAVGERLRPVGNGPPPDPSWRVENGCERPCEDQRVPAGLDRKGGVAPKHLLFGRYDDSGIRRCWLLDIEALRSAAHSDAETHPSPGGAAAAYVPIHELATSGGIINSWKLDGKNMTDDTDDAADMTEAERERINADPVLELSDFRDAEGDE